MTKGSYASGMAVLGVVLLGGCSSGSTDTTAEEPESDKPVSSATHDAKSDGGDSSQPESRCQKVSAAMQRAIASGEEGGAGMKVLDGAAVRSDDFSEAYMIALRFTVTGVEEEQVGVWSSNSLKPGGGLILAVDGFAKEFTVWPDADKTDADMTINDDGVEEAAGCMGG